MIPSRRPGGQKSRLAKGKDQCPGNPPSVLSFFFVGAVGIDDKFEIIAQPRTVFLEGNPLVLLSYSFGLIGFSVGTHHLTMKFSKSLLAPTERQGAVQDPPLEQGPIMKLIAMPVPSQELRFQLAKEAHLLGIQMRQ